MFIVALNGYYNFIFLQNIHIILYSLLLFLQWVICMGLDHNNKINLLFGCIGFATFLISGYVLRGFHPPESILYMLVIFGVLFTFGIIASKEHSKDFIIKGFMISFVTLLLISTAFFAASVHGHMNAKWIDAYRLDGMPDDFVVLTESDLNAYPDLKEAIETQSSVKTTQGEFIRTIDLVEGNGSSIVKVGDKYYSIGFMTA